eukprot:3527381-Alexandrium_andersonii.AAC.1
MTRASTLTFIHLSILGTGYASSKHVQNRVLPHTTAWLAAPTRAQHLPTGGTDSPPERGTLATAVTWPYWPASR